MQKGLSQLTIDVLTPCLLFSQVARSIDLDTLTRLWPLVVSFFFFMLMGGILGVIGGKILRFSCSQINLVVNGIIFNNIQSVPIGLIQSMAATNAIQFLFENDRDTPEKTVARGISYALLNALFANILRFSLGTWLLQKGHTDEVLVNVEEASQTNHTINSIANENTPLMRGQETLLSSSIYKWTENIYFSIKEFMNFPLLSAILAIMIGTIPQLKQLFFESQLFYQLITRPIEYIGNIAIPMTLLILGSQMNNLSTSQNREVLLPISFIMLCRLIVMPIIGIILVIATRSWYFEDPMLWFVLMVSASGPTAINLLNIAQMVGAFEQEISALLVYSYLALIPMLSVYVMIFLFVINWIK
ncbi:8603_t:CDS:2 [Ambispora gerdemannii]|uniref:8603_t:CDS:1 n=1 Tax=Ambispora gerdemannii TaxID=144530 RepID=A0A9N8V5Z2_9GLOM|nr:8603_t:CDS:2 [Ambispora gerdemannii]